MLGVRQLFSSGSCRFRAAGGTSTAGLLIQVCGGDRPYMAPADLERCHEAFCKDSVTFFRSIKKMGGEEFCQLYQNRLESELKEAYTNFSKHNEGKNIFYAARTPATLFVVMFFTYVLSGVTGFIGLSVFAALANLVLGVALLLLCIWAYVKYSGEFREAGMLIDQLAEALWEQVLKPLVENYMEDNVRQTVFNSIRASLAEQGSRSTRLKTD